MALEKFKKNVEVAYATPEIQRIYSVETEINASVEEVIFASGILKSFPSIDLTQQFVGIFSKKVALGDIPKDGDRIEIYRPLLIDPKTARVLRAKRKTK